MALDRQSEVGGAHAGAVVLDHTGVYKADVGIRDGRISAIGKAGNPDTMPGVHPDLVVGPSTEVIAGNGRILTAGGVDFLVLNLEWEAPGYALDWADRVLDAHPDRTVIMATHSFLSITGTHRTTPQRPGGTAPAASGCPSSSW